MDTYLVDGPRVLRVDRSELDDADDSEGKHWSLDGDEAVFRRRHAIERIVPPRELIFYTSCDRCDPVLVRGDHPRAWGDLLDERKLWVEFRATFESDGRRRLELTSGTRDDLVTELRADGLRVMRDDEPLAIAHREIRAARDARPVRRRRTR